MLDSLPNTLRATSLFDLVHVTQILEVAVRLAERSGDPSNMLSRGIPAAARALSSEQFADAMIFAKSLVERGINPTSLLGR